MITTETLDMFENDRSVIFTSAFYNEKEMRRIVKRSNSNFNDCYWKEIANIASLTCLRMYNHRKQNLSRYNRGLGIPSKIQFRLDTAKSAIDRLTTCKKYNTVVENIDSCITELARIAPTTDSPFHKGYMHKLSAMQTFISKDNLIYLRCIEFDTYRKPQLF